VTTTGRPRDAPRPATKPGVAGWSLLLPPGWWHIRLDERRDRSIHAMLDRLLASLPRDRVFPWRRDLTARLTEYVDRAVAENGNDLYLLADLRYGMPVAASCLASVVPVDVPADLPAELLAEILAAGPGDEPGTIMVAGRPCARVRRDLIANGSRDGGDGDVESVDQARGMLPSTGLDVHVPFPDGGRTLLLSFATPVQPLAKPMTTLFEAIAGSLQWRWE
jgi:hypothetical protein